MPELERNCTVDCMDTYLSNNSDWVGVHTIVSTSPKQIAIAPGSLVREWTENGRRYFEYKLDHFALNFYSFLSRITLSSAPIGTASRWKSITSKSSLGM